MITQNLNTTIKLTKLLKTDKNFKRGLLRRGATQRLCVSITLVTCLMNLNVCLMAANIFAQLPSSLSPILRIYLLTFPPAFFIHAGYLYYLFHKSSFDTSFRINAVFAFERYLITMALIFAWGLSQGFIYFFKY